MGPPRTLLVSFLALVGCGGGVEGPFEVDGRGDTDESSEVPADGDSPDADEPTECDVTCLAGDGAPAPSDLDPEGPTDLERTAAATATAESESNACAAIRPFYWEVGRSGGRIASGSIGGTYSADAAISIASASKWLYGAYVLERRAGEVTAEDVKFLTFKSGYTSFAFCPATATVDGCLSFASNGDYNADDDGFFRYGGGHMQKHASLLGLGAMKNAALAEEVRGTIGDDVPLTYDNPQPAGGGVLSPTGYAIFLRKLIAGDLRLGALLGAHAVCTNPATCSEAKGTPIPSDESWHYALGHWVEDDPVVGDGAFSSPGAFGFYPWIDAGKTTYGIVARDVSGGAIGSVDCGRLIRKAWLTAEAL